MEKMLDFKKYCLSLQSVSGEKSRITKDAFFY